MDPDRLRWETCDSEKLVLEVGRVSVIVAYHSSDVASALRLM